jgi:hypothetical protein
MRDCVEEACRLFDRQRGLGIARRGEPFHERSRLRVARSASAFLNLALERGRSGSTAVISARCAVTDRMSARVDGVSFFGAAAAMGCPSFHVAASRRLGARWNIQCPLLPNLLPNAVGRPGSKTDEERLDTQKALIDRGVRGCVGMERDGSERICRPLRNHSATWPKSLI